MNEEGVLGGGVWGDDVTGGEGEEQGTTSLREGGA